MWNQVLDNALREPAGRWETEGVGFMLARDYCKAKKGVVVHPVTLCDGRYNEPLDTHSGRHDQRD